jgi:MoaA/NifB/PqqE/SkfB family radical SAM enzyme
MPTMEFTTSIDTKNGCVVDCVFCPQRTLQKSYKGERFLSLENFQKAVDKMPEEIRVTFAGFTEPWLNPKTTDMLLYANQKGHPISVFTTGIGMILMILKELKIFLMQVIQMEDLFFTYPTKKEKQSILSQIVM